jgi:hypothetical protein
MGLQQALLLVFGAHASMGMHIQPNQILTASSSEGNTRVLSLTMPAQDVESAQEVKCHNLATSR